ncbi:hypothetical protein [Lactiplantibacillus paraxiangfangensis]|uniref:hypothetical protein n=1 Tax=Lactiplantibacillus paraxiangfangensis TaxID=3076224 RepID=UPI0030C73DF1
MLVFIVIIAGLMTIPIFAGGYFSISWDGRIHLARFQQIVWALKAHHLPSLVSFVGFGQQLSTLNGMYPWLTSGAFFWPSLFTDNPLRAIKLGFLVVNILTGVAAFVLMRTVTKNRYYQSLGVSLYMLNTYHLTLLYARVDLGEILAYVFLPFVMLGCLRIWQSPGLRSRGWCWLATGMIGVANSHVLSLLIVTSLLVVMEISRLVLRRPTRQEIVSLVVAGGVSILGSCYSLGNIIYIASHNHLLAPQLKILPITPNTAVGALLSGGLNERFDTWNVGIVMSILLIIQLITMAFLMVHQRSADTWQKWAWASLVLVVLPASWWPYQLLVQTPVALIQFPGRLLSIAGLVLAITTVLYFKEFKLHPRIAVGVQVVLMLMALRAVYDYAVLPQDVTNNPGRVQLTGENYQQELINNTVLGEDYLPAKANLTVPRELAIKTVDVKDNQITYKVKASRAGNYRLPIAHYQGISYQIRLNQKIVKSLDTHQMKFALNRGGNVLTVQSNAPMFDYALLGISLVTVMGCLLYLGVRMKLIL